MWRRVVPQPGMAIPFYWQEGIEFAVNRRNTFAVDEMVGILRGDGDIKFGTVMKVLPGREGNVYDILVSKDGSYQPGKTPDNLYKVCVSPANRVPPSPSQSLHTVFGSLFSSPAI